MSHLSPVPLALVGLLRLGETARRVPGASRYFVTDSGRVFSAVDGVRELRSHTRRYERVDVWFDGPEGTTRRRVVSVHVLVALAFLGPRPTAPGVYFDVDHVNGDRLDNRAANLRYLPKSENAQRSWRSARHPRSKLSPVVVWSLRCRAHAEGDAVVIAEAADRFGITARSVRAALAGRTWRWVPSPADRPTAADVARALGVGSPAEVRRLLALSPFAAAPVRALPTVPPTRRAA